MQSHSLSHRSPYKKKIGIDLAVNAISLTDQEPAIQEWTAAAQEENGGGAMGGGERTLTLPLRLFIDVIVEAPLPHGW